MASDAASAVEDLFAGSPDDFVARRDALAKQLRAGGDKAAATEVKALRRPTAAAWAVNHLARVHADDVAALVAAGDRLRRAQEALLNGDGDADLRAAMADRRALVAKLAKLGTGLLGAGGPAQREAITDTLEAAVTDAEAGEAVLAGRLSKELQAPSGFGGLMFGGDVPERRSPTAPSRRPAPATSEPKAKTAQPEPDTDDGEGDDEGDDEAPDEASQDDEATDADVTDAARDEAEAEAEAEAARAEAAWAERERRARIEELTARAERTAARAERDGAAARRTAEEVARLEERLAEARASAEAARDRSEASAAEAAAAARALEEAPRTD